MPRRRRREQGFTEWAVRGLIRSVLALTITVVAGYLVYLVVQWAFAETVRKVLGGQVDRVDARLRSDEQLDGTAEGGTSYVW